MQEEECGAFKQLLLQGHFSTLLDVDFFFYSMESFTIFLFILNDRPLMLLAVIALYVLTNSKLSVKIVNSLLQYVQG